MNATLDVKHIFRIVTLAGYWSCGHYTLSASNPGDYSYFGLLAGW
jgi:hypothetical protein